MCALRKLPADRRVTMKIEGWMFDFQWVRQRRPWHTNFGKPQVKAPNIYARESGPLPAFPIPGCPHRRRADLLLMKGSRRYGLEVKFQDVPRVTPFMRNAWQTCSCTI
jgi:hypothetical protein